MTYVYGCRCCGHEFEVERSIKDEDPYATCPRCLVCTTNRLVTGGSGFLLKGDGWAKDNYGSKR